MQACDVANVWREQISSFPLTFYRCSLFVCLFPNDTNCLFACRTRMCACLIQGLAADKPSDARNFPCFPFSSHNYCLSPKHMAVAVHHVFCALHPLLRVCCCLLLCIPASQPHSPPIRVRGRVGGSHRGGAIWQPPCPLWCRVGGTTHRLFISVVHWEGRVTFTVRGSARDRDE